MAEMFDKQIIGSVSDVYKKIDGQPDILLYTPTFQLVGVIAPCYDVHGTLKFNDKSELSFSVPYCYAGEDGNTIYSSMYSQIKRTMLLRIPDMGWWYINDISQKNDGVEQVLYVTAYSYEHTLTLRSVNLYSASQSDNNTMVLSLYTILSEFKKQTGWGLPQYYYDRPSDYMHPNKQFAIELNTSWYEFLKNTVQEAFDCFVFFDYENLEIDVKLSYSQVYLRKSNVVLSFDNLLKDVSIDETSQKTATALYVKGKDIDIRDVNPLGTSIIYNFTPYLNTTWMSQSTIDAVNAWQDKINDYTDIYKNLVGFRNFLIDFKQTISTQITEVEGEISKYKDRLSLREDSSSLWTKNGTNYKTASSARAILTDTLDCISYALSVLTSNTSDCYSVLSNLSSLPTTQSSASLATQVLGTYYPQEKYEFDFNSGTNTGSWKTYLYRYIDLYEGLSNANGDINIFKLNKNLFGVAIIEYYIEHQAVPSIGYITNQLKWENNFTPAQLKELSKYIIDASYHADEYEYDRGDSYSNLINPFKVQIGCVHYDPASDISSLSNPDDPWTYGVGYWTTDFISLPSTDENLRLKFFNKETGNLIYPYAVNLYNETKTQVYYYCNTDGRTLLESWNDGVVTFPDNTKPKYLRASFKYPYEFSSQNDIVPIFGVVCSLGSTYQDLNKKNLMIAESLKEQAEKKHEELCLPCRSFSINTANFLQVQEYSLFANDLSLGANVKAEIAPNRYEDVRLLELSFSFEDVDSLSMVFGNKYGVNNDRIMFRQLISSSGNTFEIQDSFTSFEFQNNVLR